jgi:hypothetical protein
MRGPGLDRSLRHVPPPSAGDRAAGFRSAESCSRTRKCTESVSPSSSSPDRPSPKRLPGGRAFNLGRSVLGALGNLTTHLSSVKPIEGQYVANCDFLRFSQTILSQRGRSSRNACRNAPRPVLLRPAFRLTSAEAIACRRAIDLRRSVLGAPGTLGPRDGAVKRPRNTIVALCEILFTMRTYLR